MNSCITDSIIKGVLNPNVKKPFCTINIYSLQRMLRNRQKGDKVQWEERIESRVKLIWGGNDAHRIIRTTLRYLLHMSHHKFSPHQTGVVLHLYHNKAQTWTSGPISWHLWLRTNVKVESFPTDSFKDYFLEVSMSYSLVTLFIQGTKADTLV